jgi:AmmeMemoRadiSam system protein A
MPILGTLALSYRERFMVEKLTQSEKEILLKLARQSIEWAVRGQSHPPLQIAEFTPNLKVNAACFVTLTKAGQLRGCIGALEASMPLVEDVYEHAAAAALEDYRFPQVAESELSEIQIGISRLTNPQPLNYSTQEDLLSKLHPGLDGVVIKDGRKRATFLPQVWEQVKSKEEFMDHLCYKMGVARDIWRNKHLEVLIYNVDEFHE